MIKNFFVTGTDTGIGKTLVSAILTMIFQGCYWKPIQTGIQDELPDRDQVQKLTGLPDSNFFASFYLFSASLSPDQAAFQENVEIDLNHCTLPTVKQSLIIEGAGGVYVPLNKTEFMLDLMKKFNLPVILVSRGTLGTINHTLLTIKALCSYGLTIQGIIFNGALNKDNQIAIEQFGKVKTLFHIPFFESIHPANLQNWVKENQQIILERFI